MVSAGDVERFAYCAHNWWLAQHGTKAESGEGIARHEDLGHQQEVIEGTRIEAERAIQWSLRIVMVAVSTTVLVLEVLFLAELPLAFLFIAITCVMVAASAGLLIIHGIETTRHDRALRQAGLPPGAVLDSDLAAEGRLLEDPEWGLAGRPDSIMRTGSGVIPVEVKTGRTPHHPYESHQLQLAVYLRLVEVDTGVAPTYGLLTYPDGVFPVFWNDSLQVSLRGVLDRMAKAQEEGVADRDHQDKARCRGCARRHECDQRLA